MITTMITNTTTLMTMPIDARLLTLTQWLSPAFPVGAFAYSHGLEQAVRTGWVKDGPSLLGWLEDVARHGSGQSDAIWIRMAYVCADLQSVETLNAQCRAFAPAMERRREAERQGRAFATVASEVWSLTLPNLQFPVALGYAARQEGLDLDSVVTLYLQGILGNLVAAAQRLMPLGQTEAQAILSKLNPICLQIAQTTGHMGLDDISSTAFLSDIAAMRHETLQPRIFQS